MRPLVLERGHQLAYTKFFDDGVLPETADVDAVIAMGGPMSVNDEAAFPWLSEEKAFLRECIEAGKPTLGVCLGAQLIAAALGAEVGPSPEREIGWFETRRVPTLSQASLELPERFVPLHWHGEMFAIPAGAQRLASSAGCPNQAFSFGPTVLGFQFHLEATPESVRGMVDSLSDYREPGKWVRDADALLEGAMEHSEASNTLLRKIFDQWIPV